MEYGLKSGRKGIAGFYRFTNPEWEAQYRLRRAQWCFWPALIHVYVYCLVELVSLTNFIGTTPLPLTFWLKFGVEVLAGAFLAALHLSPLVQRHILLFHTVFIWVVVALNAVTIPLYTEAWTESSYAYLVPTGSSAAVVSPSGGLTPLDAKLSGHLAALSFYRAMQVALTNSFAPVVHNMMRGLNWWSLTTIVWIFAALSVGMSATPEVNVLSAVSNSVVSLSLMLMSVLFSIAFERMQRQNFEAERLLAWELQASRMADTVLSHTLKNTLADVAGNIEMFLAGALESKALRECILSLRRGMRSCKERLVYLKLAAGQYQPVLNAVPLQEFGRGLIAGRDVKGQFPDCTVYADLMLLTLIFDNALSNAAKHGSPLGPDVHFEVTELPWSRASTSVDDEEKGGSTNDGRRRFRFEVRNKAHPGRPPLTPAAVAQLFAGRAPQAGVTPLLSDGLGLSHCVLAARLGGIDLSLTQENGIVTFRGVLEAQVAPDSVCWTRAEADGVSGPANFPPGLSFVVMDDSPMAQQLLKFHIEKWCRPASVECFGASAGDVEPFLQRARDADIVILDQHLDWDRPCLGTDLLRRLHYLQFQGFACIRAGGAPRWAGGVSRSADDGPEDQEKYEEAGANLSVGKDLLGADVMRQLQAAYECFRPSPSRGSITTLARTQTQPAFTAGDLRLLGRPFSPERASSPAWAAQDVELVPGCVAPFAWERFDSAATLRP